MSRVVVLTVSLTLLAGVSSAEQQWFAAEARDVRVLSNASPSAASRALGDIEFAEALFRSIANATVMQPVRAFAVKDADSLRELAPQFWERRGIRPHAVAYAGPFASFLAVREDLAPAVRREALLHEYVHLLTAEELKDAPAWIDEGLAEFWGSVVVEGDRVIVGRAVKKHVARLGRWQSMERTLRLPRGEFIADSEPSTLFYAQSWAMVHYLLLGRNALTPTALVPEHKTLPDDFESAVRQYVEDGMYREVVLPLAMAPQPSVNASFIPEARSLAERAQMLVFGPRPDAGAALAKRALALEPRDAMALEVMGTYYFLQNKHADARTWLTRAFDTGLASPAAAIYLALLAPSNPEKERYLTAAVGAQPHNETAWQRLIAIYKEDGRLDQLRQWCNRWRAVFGAMAAVPECR